MKAYKSFQHYVKEDLDRGVVLFWGRCNPPTIGHEAVFNFGAQLANKQGWPFKIYITHTKDNKKNPLSYEDKVSFMKSIFPRYKNYVVESDLRTITAVLQSLQNAFANVILVTGEDRVDYFQNIFDKYNSRDYNFKSIRAVSSGKRDPEAEGIAGMSSSKMRELVKTDNFEEFKNGLPSSVSLAVSKKMFMQVSQGLGLLKSNEVELTRSEARELFYSKKLVKIGDKVSTNSIDEAVVVKLGPNFIVLETNGQTSKCWPEDIRLYDK